MTDESKRYEILANFSTREVVIVCNEETDCNGDPLQFYFNENEFRAIQLAGNGLFGGEK